MDVPPKPLAYWTPKPRHRLPIFSAIGNVLAAAVLIAMGGLLLLVMLAMLYEDAWRWDRRAAVQVVLLMTGAALLLGGLLALRRTVLELRGFSPRTTRLERWAARLSRHRMERLHRCPVCGGLHQGPDPCPRCGEEARE
jgi:MFS family permease